MRVSGVLLASLVTVASASSRLDVIDLPTGFFPEGITSGGGWTAFVGSLVGEFHIVVLYLPRLFPFRSAPPVSPHAVKKLQYLH